MNIELHGAILKNSSGAADLTIQGQMLWTVEDAREEVIFPSRFPLLASPQPCLLTALASSSIQGLLQAVRELRVFPYVYAPLLLRACVQVPRFAT